MVRVKDTFRPKRKTDQLLGKQGTRMSMILRGKQAIKTIYKILYSAEAFMIPHLYRHVEQFFEYNICQDRTDPQSHARILVHVTVEAHNSLEISIPYQDVDVDSTYKVQHLRVPGRKSWLGGETRRDPAWVHVGSMCLDRTSNGGRLKCSRVRAI